MADRMNIKFTIQAVDRFSATMNKLNRKLEQLKATNDKLDLDRDAEINVDTDNAKRNITEVFELMDGVNNRGRNNRFDIDVSPARRSLGELGDYIRNDIIPRESFDIDADFSRMRRGAERTRVYMGELFESRQLRIEGDIDVDTGDASARVSLWARAMAALARIKANIDLDVSSMARVRAAYAALKLSIERNPIRILISDNYKTFRRRTADFATNLRNMGEIFQGMLGGIVASFHTILSPMVASTTGAIAGIGAMIGTTAGATMGLVSAFTFAGASAVGFAAVAIPSITKLHETIDEIQALDEKIQAAKAAGDMEKAAEATAELNAVLDGMSEAQKKARLAVGGLSEQYKGLVKAMEPGVLTAYGNVLVGLTRILEIGEETIKRSVDAVVRLTESFNANIEAKDMKDFFKFLEDNGANILETITKALGNFVAGFLNLMTSFGPLALTVSDGFLKMSESFRDWASSLSESEKFQAFVDYVNRNFPVVREIFGDVINGIIGLFVAFAPYAEDWMQRTRDMMNSFRDFSESLGENQKFQEFVQYVRDNAPAVTTMIGKFFTALVELGIAMAPLGSKMVEVATAFFEWIIAFRQANPLLSQILPLIITLVGLFVLLYAPVMLAVSVFQFLVGIFRIVIPWVIRIAGALLGLSGPVLIVIGIVIALATAIYANWGTIGPWITELWEKVKVAFMHVWENLPTYVSVAMEAIRTFVSAGFDAVQAVFTTVLTNIISFVVGWWAGVQSSFATAMATIVGNVATFVGNVRTAWEVLRNAVVTAATNLATGAITAFNNLRNGVSTATNAVRTVATTAWNAIRTAVTTAARNAHTAVATAFNQMRAAVSTAVSNILGAVIRAFANLVRAVGTAMSNAYTAVTTAWGNVMSYLRGIDLFSIGTQMISGLINGIKSMAGGLVEAAKGVVGGAIEGAKALLKIKSPSRVFRDIGRYTMQGMVVGIDKEAQAVINSVTTVAEAMTDAFAPELNAQMAGARAGNAYTGASQGYSQAVASAAEDKRRAMRTVVEVPVYLNGREIAKASNAEHSQLNRREEERKAAFRGEGGA